MKYTMKKLKFNIGGILLAACVAVPAVADDIEIYTSLSSGQLTIQPNLLFVLDSSGSMNTTITTATIPYDPSVVYPGGCGAGRVYFTSGGRTPSCRSSDYFYDAANKCDHSINEYDGDGNLTGNPGPLSKVGFYTGQIAQFTETSSTSRRRRSSSSASWGALSIRRTSDRDKPIECYQDRGIHGETGSSPKVYIENTTDAWTNQETPDPHSVWSGGGSNYTLYHYNYINYLNDPTQTTTSTRFIEMQNSILALTDANSNINIALMRFDSAAAEGGAVMYPMEDINSARNDFQSRVKTMNAGGYTPLAETYYEALLYYGGAEIYYGNDANPSTQTGTAELGTGNKVYQTPITDVCQKNYIIYLTDGEPTKDQLTSAELSALPGMSTSCASSSTPATLDNCLAPLAGWAYDEDVGHRAIPAHDGDQQITTYTIGFDLDAGASAQAEAIELLKRTAKAGGGSFHTANNSASLTTVFNQIIAEVLAVNSTFSSPAVSVNAFNRATNLDDLYFTLFKPSGTEHWEGNLKKFKLEFDAGVPFVADSNHDYAVDVSTGFFKDSSVSYWTLPADAPDGAETAAGGAAGMLSVPRSTYTFTGSYSGTTGVLTPSDGDLTSSTNKLDWGNANITDAMLGGVATEPDVLYSVAGMNFTVSFRVGVLAWAWGYDMLDDDADSNYLESRRDMGDPLHAEPALVQYGLTAGDEPDMVAYVATNDGYLHGIDSLTGKENFAFVPQEMLSELQYIFEDTGVTGKAYGLDGNVIPWINDADRDGTISGADEHVYLYFGMRRGGRYIYSMDVTNRDAPKLRWVIEGGTGDYAELGDTWSAPNVEKIKINGIEKTVLIFGAGYDTAQDSLTERGVDSVGRGIFIVDADSGEMLWRAGPDAGADLQLADMEYSIPARIKPIDIDGDSLTDRLYAGDMGGQLWRIDIDNNATGSGISVTGGRIADLSVDASTSNNRRFYSPPDAALILEEGQAPYISIVAASGYRAHPLQMATHDRVYMIRDYDVYQVPTTYTTITEADLFDTTSNVIGEGVQADVDAAKASLNGAKGWYITFNEMDGSFIGEKALSEPLILNGVAIFTTYIPGSIGATSASCTANDGTGAIYFVNAVDGTPTSDNTGDADKTREDRRVFLARGGIPPTPRVIITKDGIPTLCVGTECSKAGDVGTLQKMYWYEIEE